MKMEKKIAGAMKRGFTLVELLVAIAVVGVLAAEVVSMAIIKAVESAESAYGFPSASELWR